MSALQPELISANENLDPNTIKWDLRFLEIAQVVAQWSKDPSTKVGAVCVGDQRQVLSTGYNGFPRGMMDYPVFYEDRVIKLERIIHAERNVILNAGLTGISLAGATMYVWGCPVCNHCALDVIQVGIKRVVMQYPSKFNEEGNVWYDRLVKTKSFFEEVRMRGATYEWYAPGAKWEERG